MHKIILFLMVFFLLVACVGSAPEPKPTAVSSTAPEGTVSAATSSSASGVTTPLPATVLAQTPTIGELPATSATETGVASTPAKASEPPADAVVFPALEQFNWVQVAAGLNKPVGIANAGDGTGRMFVIEQPGTVRIMQNGELKPDPFLDIRAKVGSQGSEQGLLGLAFHPQFTENGYFFISYTDLQGDSVVSRFEVDPGSPDRVDASRETPVLSIAQPFANHNGGGLAFGPDGYLYLGFGDGGSAGDPQGNGQSLNTLLGKLLRLDVDGGTSYAIPEDNPYKNGGAEPEIWAYGLRNPWRFSFDALKGDLYIADVGQNQWEEINYLPAGTAGGVNFGWNLYEGSHPFETRATSTTSLTSPIFEYSHENGCSVTGGVVYRGKNLAEFSGIYLFGDYCSGMIWGLMKVSQDSWQNMLLFDGMGQISSFGEDEQHEIYLVIHSGTVFRLERK